MSERTFDIVFGYSLSLKKMGGKKQRKVPSSPVHCTLSIIKLHLPGVVKQCLKMDLGMQTNISPEITDLHLL